MAKPHLKQMLFLSVKTKITRAEIGQMSSSRTAAVPLSCVWEFVWSSDDILLFRFVRPPINARHKLNPSVNSALEIQHWKITNYCHLKLQQWDREPAAKSILIVVLEKLSKAVVTRLSCVWKIACRAVTLFLGISCMRHCVAMKVCFGFFFFWCGLVSVLFTVRAYSFCSFTNFK